jgi:regulator of nucleoside diphosphate kinase
MITSDDYYRILKVLLKNNLSGKLSDLEQKLHSSEIVDPRVIPPDVITMNSEVMMLDQATNERIKVKLVYDFSPLFGSQTSVIAPLGSALLGARKNEDVKYKARDASERNIRILDIIFQPEREGLYDL